MNAYVGRANSAPDSRTPRRLATVIKAMRPMEIGTACGRRFGANDTIATTPATTDTATVST
jgi:hypothetical protein